MNTARRALLKFLAARPLLAASVAMREERVLDIVNMDLRLAMVGCGARTVKEISRSSIIDAGHT